MTLPTAEEATQFKKTNFFGYPSKLSHLPKPIFWFSVRFSRSANRCKQMQIRRKPSVTKNPAQKDSQGYRVCELRFRSLEEERDRGDEETMYVHAPLSPKDDDSSKTGRPTSKEVEGCDKPPKWCSNLMSPIWERLSGGERRKKPS